MQMIEVILSSLTITAVLAIAFFLFGYALWVSLK